MQLVAPLPPRSVSVKHHGAYWAAAGVAVATSTLITKLHLSKLLMAYLLIEIDLSLLSGLAVHFTLDERMLGGRSGDAADTDGAASYHCDRGRRLSDTAPPRGYGF